MNPVDDVLSEMRTLGSPENIAGMMKFGITGEIMYGVTVQNLRLLARKLGTDHKLALDLWDSRVHEARILASMLDDPRTVTEDQIDRWVLDLDSWDLCDQLCGNLLVDVSFARERIRSWIKSNLEFVRRAGFALIVEISVKDKKAEDAIFLHYLDLIEHARPDSRRMVRKAINWALRTIGKRNRLLNQRAIETAERMKASAVKDSQWIASDALRELRSSAVQKRLSGRR